VTRYNEFEPGAHPGSVLARLAEPTAATETTLAVIADPHVGKRTEGTSKLFDRTETHFGNALADASERGVDAVCSVGDLTKDGEPYNYDAVDRAVDALDVPFYAVPGNHDVPKSRDEHDTRAVSEFAARYAPGGAYPFSASVGDIDIVGFNTAGTADRLFESHDGQLDPEKADAIREALAAADNPIVLAHHNLPAMFDQLRAHRDAVEPEMGIPPITRRGDAYAETLAEGDTSLLLTGHLHMPATATQAGVREVMVPTTCSFPQAYLTVTVDADGTTVRFHPVADRDGTRYAFEERSKNSATSRGLTAMAADRLARFPLVDEQP
jgi:3',5'-cyclic AMP phosphodiesterase CpdA